MKLLISIDTGNAAFSDMLTDQDRSRKEDQADAKRRECAFVLKQAIQKLEAGYESGSLRDSNGNHVGNYRFTKR